jgi:hypothetical protein
MKLIAHRGLVNGPNKHIENQPATIKSALYLLAAFSITS